MRQLLLIVVFVWCSTPARVSAQTAAAPADDHAIAAMVERLKQDPRGPYRDIRWFCPDGTTVAPSERCPERGVQRARYKDEVNALAASNHVFLGQILSATDYDAFWDAASGNSRLKQYLLEKYLRQIDDGWVNRRAQSYRGAYQAEDEDEWGLKFLRKLALDPEIFGSQFYLIRQTTRDLPHRADDNLAQRVRTESKEIADAYPAFMDIRVKIHGQPDSQDAERVRQFQRTHANSLTGDLDRKLEKLANDLDALFSPANLSDVTRLVQKLPSNSHLRDYLTTRLEAAQASSNPGAAAGKLADAAFEIRKGILEESTGSARITLLDISSELEELLTVNLSTWRPETLGAELRRFDLMTRAAAGFGLIELWEYDQCAGELARLSTGVPMPLKSLQQYLDETRRIVEWGTLTVHATFEDVVTLYTGFELRAAGFYDEKVRSSILLQMGASVGRLAELVAREAGFSNSILGIPNPGHARGLNPGLAKGTLRVVQGEEDNVDIDPAGVYVFVRPPSDLKPVAGILTVTEGNMVSHVQLLARNLGIPNAVISAANLHDLIPFSNREVFYAVSDNGAIVMKLASDMTADERKLFEVKKRSETKITVPVSRMDLGQRSVLNLADVDATLSGRITGPKAANLGQLKRIFPDHVVDGLVIPFGIFREHMEQPMPDTGLTFWAFLTESFAHADTMRTGGEPEEAIEAYLLGRLERIRAEIKRMPLRPEFVSEFKQRFREILGSDLGTVPVFLRSDTNMEDLKDFTGAGLNLTLFNVLDEEKIFQGIRDVWASPYTERSFRWRQRYLLNPENVYPSILVIPSVDADYSGVMITKGVSGGSDDDVTVAFNRGVGGAVDGQAAESWLLEASGRNLLLSPAREPMYTSIPKTGGTQRVRTTFAQRILTEANLGQLRELSTSIELRLPGSPGIETRGPFDVELGFKSDKIWLFQVRPFVENKLALSSEYLSSISPAIPADRTIPLSQQMP